jgi:hypothetical protein
MTDLHPAEPRRDTRGMLLAVCIAVAVLAIALIFFVVQREGTDGALPGTQPTTNEAAPSGGTADPGTRGR